MRVLLTSNASHDPPRGGSTRSNLVWLRQLAAAGHDCRIVGASLAEDQQREVDGIRIHSVKDLAKRAFVLGEEIRAFDPDWVLVSSEDLSHVLLREADKVAAGRMIYLAHTPQFLPFGPESWYPDARATAIIQHARAVVAIGHHMGDYIERHAGVTANIIHPPIYGTPPFRRCGGFDAPLVLMINPCEVKGIRIFLALARDFPDLQFAALIGWGTTSADKDAMAERPNVRLLASVPDIEDVLSQARLLLMPSVWYEGFGLIAMEAMLRGLPVIASDSGGLKEAMQGSRMVIPVRPIEQYLPEFDEVRMPKAVVPPQDLEPWTDAVRTLTTNRRLYEAESQFSRAAALRFVSDLDASAFERLLSSLPAAKHETPSVRMDDLTPAQRTLLLRRLMRLRGKA
jgi:glycosyltransferase involved in cell wall biosynthesis